MTTIVLPRVAQPGEHGEERSDVLEMQTHVVGSSST